MLSELTHRQHPHHFSQRPYANYEADCNNTPRNAFADFSPGGSRSQRLAQNASFRQRSERQQQYARPIRKGSSPAHQLLSSAPYQQDTEASEHLLRRKTPNGTLAAGYDGSPVEWTKRPHAMKHLLMPMPRTSPTAAFPTALAARSEIGESQGPKPSQSFAARTEKQQYRKQSGIYPSGGGLQENLERGMGCRSNGASVPWFDSMLNQSSLQAQPFHLGAIQNVPTVLQPMWPPCLGPTSIQTPGPFGPYWPDGAFVPYRPAPLRDPRFQASSSNGYVDLFPQTHSVQSDGREWSRSDSGYAEFNNAGATPFTFPTPSQHPHMPVDLFRNSAGQEGSDNRTLAPMPRQNGLPNPYRKRPSSWDEKRPHSMSQVYNDFGALSFDSNDASLSLSQDSATSVGNAQFKEKVLSWAHKVYCSLLASLEQSCRNQANGSHGVSQSQSSYFPQPPRRPYPSWSSSQSRDNSYSSKGHTHSPSENNGGFQKVSASVTQRTDPHRPDVYKNGYLSSSSYALPRSPPEDDAPHFGPPHNVHHRMLHSSAQPSYVPPQLTQDNRAHSPQTAALYAMEMLHRLCKESGWEWTDGMLLNGCLAYGLCDYEQAREWYLRVVQRDPKNVEALSNLAATLLSLGCRRDAEQYWLHSVKLRPSYFEAVEHLVGLLHEEHRGRETVRVIKHVEQVLRKDSPALSPDQQLDFSRYAVRSARRFSSGYAIPPSDNGRMLALIHGKGNVLYQSGDNDGAAKAFEDAILIGAGTRHQGIKGLIQRILRVFSERLQTNTATSHDSSPDEPVLLPPNLALETSRLVFPSQGQLPGLEEVPPGMSQKAAVSIVSNSLLSLAKIYQDGMSSSDASATTPRATSGVQDILALYYLSLSLQPSPSTANNVGILLAGVQQSARAKLQVPSTNAQTIIIPGVVPGSGIALALAYYDYGLKLDARHAHLYTNLGSLFKDIGQLSPAIRMYERAVACDPNFDIALANLANAVKDKGNIAEAINYYKGAVSSNPDFAEAVCGLANALNSVCSWSGRGGINHPAGNRDRWHVDEHGVLYDSKKCALPSSGWIERVVTIVDKQLRDGQNWGKGVLKSVGLESMLQQICRAPTTIQILGDLRSALKTWAEKTWEGAKIVRLVERATKRLSWQMYQDKYVVRCGYEVSSRTRPQLPAALAVPSAPTVLPFHTFTCPLSAKQIRKISQRNGLRVSCSTLRASWLPAHIYEPPAPPKPHLNVGYISSDFNNHPLAHLMQSVFGFHDLSKVKAFCYATTPSDGSIHRQQIERESPVFQNASSWSIEHLVNQIVADGIHILVNLNGYTRGAKNEVFAARPAPIQMSFMGFAGTLGAEWCDYLLADTIAIPPETLRPWRGNAHLLDQTQDGNNDDEHDDWVYGENIIFTKDTFFCCDHKQSAPDAQEAQLSWPEEQRRRWTMRKELFPKLADDAIILGNFNQLYKVFQPSLIGCL